MKKLLAILLACAIVVPSFAINPVEPGPLKASAVRITVGNTGQVITLDDLAHMKASEYSGLTGRKMNFFSRIGFSIAQRQLRNSIKKVCIVL